MMLTRLFLSPVPASIVDNGAASGVEFRYALAVVRALYKSSSWLLQRCVVTPLLSMHTTSQLSYKRRDSDGDGLCLSQK